MRRRRHHWHVMVVACLCAAATSRAIRMVPNNMEEDDIIISRERKLHDLQDQNESHDTARGVNYASEESTTDGESQDSHENETKQRVPQHENTKSDTSKVEWDSAARQGDDLTEDVEKIRRSEADDRRADPRPVSEQVKAYYEAQATDSFQDETIVIEERGTEVSSKDGDNESDDVRIRHADSNEKAPAVRKDPRPVSEQVKAYYEYIAKLDSDKDTPGGLDSSDESADSTESEPNTEAAARQSTDETSLEGSGTTTATGSETEKVESSTIKDEAYRVDNKTVDDGVGSDESETTGGVDNAEAVNELSETETDIHNEQRGSKKDNPLDNSGVSERGSMSDASPVTSQPVESVRNDTITVGAQDSSQDCNATSKGDSDISTSTSPAKTEIGETIPDKSSPQNEEGTPDEDSTTTADSDEPNSAGNTTKPDESGSNERKRTSTDGDAIDLDIEDNENDIPPAERDADQPPRGEDQQSDRHEPPETKARESSGTRTYAYVDSDVMDFDIIDRELGESDEQATGDASTEATTLETSHPDGNSQARPRDGHATKTDIQDSVSNESVPLNDSVEEIPEEKAGAAHGKPIIRPRMTTSTQDTVTKTDQGNKERPRANNDQEEFSSTGEPTASDAPQGGGWGIGTRSEQRNTALPDYLAKPLSRIKTPEDASYASKQDDIIYTEPVSLSNGNQVVDNDGPDNLDAESTKPNDEAQRERPSSVVADAPIADSDDQSKPSEKSVNSEFVEGLDDIDKFFQSVDPPDELDVGAAGSSIQEVLVGQSVQIVLKRVKLGFQFIKKRVAKVKTKVDEYWSRRTTQDGEVALITREDLKNAADKMKALGKRAFKGIQELVDDLFENDNDDDDDIFDVDNGLDQVRAKIDRLRREQFAPKRPTVDNNRGEV